MVCVCVHSPANLLLKLPCQNRADGMDRYKSCAPTMRGTTPETLSWAPGVAKHCHLTKT